MLTIYPVPSVLRLFPFQMIMVLYVIPCSIIREVSELFSSPLHHTFDPFYYALATAGGGINLWSDRLYQLPAGAFGDDLQCLVGLWDAGGHISHLR